MNYRDAITSDRRLLLLRLLNEAPGYGGNEAILRAALEGFGHHASRDQVRTDLAWLEEQDLVTTQNMADIIVATITPRGADVATGRSVVPGVRRPSPK